MSDIEVVRSVSGTGQTSGPSSKSGSKVAGNNAAETTRVDSSGGAPGVAATDEVELTSALQRLEELSASLADQPIVDRAKVDSIKQGLANGTYQVNSEQIANKLIELEKLLN